MGIAEKRIGFVERGEVADVLNTIDVSREVICRLV
jgi:hypothetical protein